MRFFLMTIGFLVFTALLFLIGALMSSGTIMISVMCLIMPAAMWVNGFAASKAGIRIHVDAEGTPEPKRASSSKAAAPAGTQFR